MSRAPGLAWASLALVAVLCLAAPQVQVEGFAVTPQAEAPPSQPRRVSRLRVRKFQSTRSRAYRPSHGGQKRPAQRGQKRPSRRSSPGWIVPYNNGLNSPVYSGDNLTAQNLLQLPIEVKHSYDTCVKRNWEVQTTQRSSYSNALLGIVVVVCNEDVRWLGKIPGGCTDKHIYIYSKCGVRTKAIKSMLYKVQQCTTIKEVDHTIMTDLTHVKMHADYLRHMMLRYDELEPSLLFLKARVGDEKRTNVMAQNKGFKNQPPSTLASVVKTALTGEWAFLGIWPNRVYNSFKFPEARGREMCELYKRFTCEEECYSCDQVNHPACYIPQSKSMFMVSRARIRSLPRTEYVAMLQWLMSYKDTFSGWLGHRRRYVMERIWPVMFGCDQDAHRYPSNYAKPPGCREDMVFGRKEDHTATTLAPPQDFISRGQVTWPQPAYLSLMPYFPHIFTWDPAVTLVTALDNPDHMVNPSLEIRCPLKDALRHSLMTAVLANPDIKVVVLVDHSSEVTTFDPVKWTGRVTMMRVRIGQPPAAAGDSLRWLEDWKTTAMQAEYLRRASTGPQAQKDHNGHIVLVRPHTIMFRSLRDIFESTPFTMAISMQPVEGRELDLSAWFVHKDHIPAAAAVMGQVEESYRGDQANALRSVLSVCFEGAGHITGVQVKKPPKSNARPAEVRGGRVAHEEPGAVEDEEDEEGDIEHGLRWPSEDKRCNLKDGTQVTLRLLPCEIFNADRGDCPPDHKAKVASVIRGRNSAVMAGMWAALQRRNRVSMMKFFSYVKEAAPRSNRTAEDIEGSIRAAATRSPSAPGVSWSQQMLEAVEKRSARALEPEPEDLEELDWLEPGELNLWQTSAQPREI